MPKVCAVDRASPDWPARNCPHKRCCLSCADISGLDCIIRPNPLQDSGWLLVVSQTSLYSANTSGSPELARTCATAQLSARSGLVTYGNTG